MLTKPSSTETILESIPDSQAIRLRLGQNAREARLLRQLLRLAERKERELQRREEAKNAG
jgi:hypothetical protein